jgi:formylmethanofuran dehydrogenase subunit E
MSDPAWDDYEMTTTAMARRRKTMRDPRYEFVRCSACGEIWQRIDFRCEVHRMTCKGIDHAEQIIIDPRDALAKVRR